MSTYNNMWSLSKANALLHIVHPSNKLQKNCRDQLQDRTNVEGKKRANIEQLPLNHHFGTKYIA